MSSSLQGNDTRTVRLPEWFMRYALLFPVIVMAGYQLGRGMGNSLHLLYLLAGLFALKGMLFNVHKRVLGALLLMFVCFLAASLYPDLSAQSLKYWLLYTLSGCVLVYTVGSFEAIDFRACYRVMAWVPVFLLVYMAVELAYFFLFSEHFVPAVQVSGMQLAALSPLILLYKSSSQISSYRFYGLFFILALLVLILADSRTEPLMLVLGFGCFVGVYRKSLGIWLFIILFALISIIVLDAQMFNPRALIADGSTYEWLDRLSSYRLLIWNEAFSHPPESLMFGAGIQRSMEQLTHIDFVKHLHNLFIEIWYETGFIGLASYLLLLGLLLSGAFHAYKDLVGDARWVYAVFVATTLATLVGGMLDKGYFHPLSRFYLLFCLTVLYLFHRKVAVEAPRTVVHDAT